MDVDPETCTDARWMWGFIEHLMVSDDPVKINVHALNMVVPSVLADDADAQTSFRWCLIANALHDAWKLRELCIGSLLRSIEPHLEERSLLPIAVLSRSMLEHAALLDHLDLFFPHLDVEKLTALKPGANLEEGLHVKDPVLNLIYRTKYGTKYPFERGRSQLNAKQLRKAEKTINKQDQALQILSVIDKVEKKRPRPGLRNDYSLLCDFAHPNRGTIELLFSAEEHLEGHLFRRHYHRISPSDEATADRLRHVLLPALRYAYEVLVTVMQPNHSLTTTFNHLGAWCKDDLEVRGYNVGELLTCHRPFPDDA